MLLRSFLSLRVRGTQNSRLRTKDTERTNERTKWNGQFGKRPKYVAAVSTIAALSQGRLQTAACPTTVAAWPAMFILSVFSFGKVKFISYNKGQIQVLSSGIWTKLWTIYQILTATPWDKYDGRNPPLHSAEFTKPCSISVNIPRSFTRYINKDSNDASWSKQVFYFRWQG